MRRAAKVAPAVAVDNSDEARGRWHAPSRARTFARRLLTAAACAALLTACGGDGVEPVAARTAAPSPSDDGKITKADALAALAASPAADWPRGFEAFGPDPTMPAGFSPETAQYALEFAKGWLNGLHNSDDVWAGRTNFWADLNDPGDQIGVREELTSGRAFHWVNAFVRSTRVVQEPSVMGAFTTSVGKADGEKTLRLTWKGTAVYVLDTIDGSGSLLPVTREITWSWFDGGSYPGVSTAASFGNVELCVVSGTGLIEPKSGDVDVDPKFFAPQPAVGTTEEQEAAQQAKIDAC